MRQRLVGTSARGLLAVLFSITTASAQPVSTAQINGAIKNRSASRSGATSDAANQSIVEADLQVRLGDGE